jgi:hypothetical protein
VNEKMVPSKIFVHKMSDKSRESCILNRFVICPLKQMLNVNKIQEDQNGVTCGTYSKNKCV